MPQLVVHTSTAKQSPKPQSVESPASLAAIASLTKTQRSKSKSLQPCQCSVDGCGKTFSKRSNLKAHTRIHSGELPYLCQFPGCTRRFRWKSSLKPHVKVHLASGHTITSSPTATSLDAAVSVPTRGQGNLSLQVSPANAALTTLPPRTVSGERFFTTPSRVCLQDTANAKDKYPAAVRESCSCATRGPREVREGDQIYSCSSVGCGQHFVRLSHFLDRERAERNRRGPVSMARILLHDSQGPEDLKEQGEIDLSCNSVLSSSQPPFDTDKVSFTLDSPQYRSASTMKAVDGDLWKSEFNVMNPFLDCSATFEVGNNDGGTFSSCISNLPTSNGQYLGHPNSPWMRQSKGCSLSNHDFSNSTCNFWSV